MSLEIVTLALSVINSIFLVYLTFILNKRQKKNEVVLNEVNELNAKMHDNLVLAEQDMKAGRYFGPKLVTALLRCASRLEKYDDSILTDVYTFMNDWTSSLDLYEKGVLPAGELSKIRTQDLEIMKLIGKKADKVFKSA